MKKTFYNILIFAVVLLFMLGMAELSERDRPGEEDSQTQESASLAESEQEDSMNLTDATTVTFTQTGASIHGEGAAVSGDTVTIVYPGTYVLSGSYQGCVVVNCSAEQNVYLVLNGVNIANPNGPAIYIKDASIGHIYLMENTENYLSDGEIYQAFTDSDMQPEAKQPDAVIYSGDSLHFSGGGSLTVTAWRENAIHTRDKLTVKDGNFTLNSVSDGMKAADGISVKGGNLVLLCGDDGLTSSKGKVTVSGGTLRITCSGDAVTAAEAVRVEDGEITVTACREGLEAPLVELSGGAVTVTADKCAVSASMGDVDSGLTAEDCAVEISGGTLYGLAPCVISSDGSFQMSGGAAFLRSSTEAKPLESQGAQVSDGTLFMSGDFEQTVLSADGGVNAVYYRSDSEIDGSQTLSISDSEDNPIFALVPNQNFYAAMIVYGGIVQGQSYSLSCGGQSIAFTPVGWMTQAVAATGRSGFGGFPGRP